MSGISVLPETASSTADRFDPLFWSIAGVVSFFGLLVVTLVVVFAIRYRRREGSGPAPQIRGNVPLEIVWTLVPTIIALGLFVWGARIYVDENRVPPGALKIHVVAKQWMWKLQHEEGHAEIDELHVPVGRDVALLLASEDVIHSFFVPAFRLKMDVVPGRYTSAWFRATRAGEYPLLCAQYCGSRHASMLGRVVAMEPAEYERWLVANRPDRPLAATGEEVFRRYQCDSCHAERDTERGPSLGGLLLRRVLLADGSHVVADENYVRESILRPGARVAAGWANVMPSYEGRLDEEQALLLLAYVESLPAPPERVR